MKLIIIVALIIAIVAIATFFVFRQQPAPVIDSIASYSCNNDNDCKLVTMTCCNNNEPTQNACISKNDNGLWKIVLQNFCGKSSICTLYLRLGNYSCFCQENRCWTNFTTEGGSRIYTGLLKVAQ